VKIFGAVLEKGRFEHRAEGRKGGSWQRRKKRRQRLGGGKISQDQRMLDREISIKKNQKGRSKQKLWGPGLRRITRKKSGVQDP